MIKSVERISIEYRPDIDRISSEYRSNIDRWSFVPYVLVLHSKDTILIHSFDFFFSSNIYSKSALIISSISSDENCSSVVDALLSCGLDNSYIWFFTGSSLRSSLSSMKFSLISYDVMKISWFTVFMYRMCRQSSRDFAFTFLIDLLSLQKLLLGLASIYFEIDSSVSDIFIWKTSSLWLSRILFEYLSIWSILSYMTLFFSLRVISIVIFLTNCATRPGKVYLINLFVSFLFDTIYENLLSLSEVVFCRSWYWNRTFWKDRILILRFKITWSFK